MSERASCEPTVLRATPNVDVGYLQVYGLEGSFGSTAPRNHVYGVPYYYGDSLQGAALPLGAIGVRHLQSVTHTGWPYAVERPRDQTAWLLSWAARPLEIAGGNHLPNIAERLAALRGERLPAGADAMVGYAVQQYLRYMAGLRGPKSFKDAVSIGEPATERKRIGNTLRFNSLRMRLRYWPPEDATALVAMARAAAKSQLPSSCTSLQPTYVPLTRDLAERFADDIVAMAARIPGMHFTKDHLLRQGMELDRNFDTAWRHSHLAFLGRHAVAVAYGYRRRPGRHCAYESVYLDVLARRADSRLQGVGAGVLQAMQRSVLQEVRPRSKRDPAPYMSLTAIDEPETQPLLHFYAHAGFGLDPRDRGSFNGFQHVSLTANRVTMERALGEPV